jgi:serine/threonine-protein kinase RsbW
MPACEFDPDKLKLRVNVCLKADPESIAPVVEGVLAIAREMKCAAGKEYEIEVSLREALANAILHGCKGDPSKLVQCCVACDEDRGLLLIVRDPGHGFDPAQIPSPVLAENLYSEHGRGIYLINQLMDEVHFAHGGTEIRMKKS